MSHITSESPMTRAEPASVQPPSGAGTTPTAALTAVVIGASAGGLEALRTLVPALPLDGAVYAVVAVHLSPAHRSMLAELLGRGTTAPVRELTDGQVPEPGHVYVVPPSVQPSLEGGVFRLTPSTLRGTPKPSIDALMLSMAESLGERLIAVILSGTGSDGSRGVRAVRAHGGMVLVQEPTDARHDGMPLHAIETRVAHHIAPAAALGAAIGRVLNRLSSPAAAIDAGAPRSIESLILEVRNRLGFDLGAYKPSTLQRRIARRMRARACASVAEYQVLMEKDPDEAQSLVQELLISVTSFFRDPTEFEALAEPLGHLMAEAAAQQRELRIWVAGCATGEEAYSMALLVRHLSQGMGEAPAVRIFATDIDAEALEIARRGIYPAEAIQELPERWRSEHLEVGNETVRVGTMLREMVIFSQHNLLRDPPFMRVDLLSCRNVLIYLQAEWQRRLLRQFERALGERGLLMLGRSEAPCSDDRIRHERPLAQTALFRLITDARDLAEPALQAVTEGLRPTAPRRAVVQRPADLGQILLAAHTAGSLAPGWVMTDEGQLLHTFGDVSGILQLSNGGPASMAISKLCDQRFWLTLRTLVFQARQQPGSPMAGWHHPAQGGICRLSVLAISPQPWCVVLCDTLPASGDSRASEAGGVNVAADVQAELVHLREHVTASQQHLGALITELDFANEEQQRLNEELQSYNEELQSTNEELATANEELQSSNEELITVNEELQMRTTELAMRNADLDNVRNSLLDPLLVVDEHGRVILRNTAAEACWQFDVAAGRLTDRPMLAALPCRFDVQPLVTATRQVLETGRVIDLELAWPDDRTYFIRVQPYIGRQGEHCGAVVLMRDITQDARLQRTLNNTVDELQRSEALRRATVDALPDLICVLDDAGTITGVNAAWTSLGRQRGGDLSQCRLGIGVNYNDVCLRAAASGDSDALGFLRGLTAVQRREQAIFELTYPCRTNELLSWHRASITPLEGTSHGVVVRHQDVTEMHTLLQRLKLKQRALDATPNGIVVCNAKQAGLPIVYVNQAFETLTGFPAADVLGRSCAILQGNDRQQAGLVALRQALAARRPIRVLLRNYRRSGEMFWNELSISMLEDGAGDVTHVIGVQRDVTAVLASEEALRASQRREAQALSFAGLGTLDWRLRDGRLVISKQQACLFGLDEACTEVIWADLRERFFADDLPAIEDAVKVCVAGHAALDIEVRLRAADGSARWLHLQGNAERDDQGAAIHLMAICQDITARRAAEEHATHLSQHDSLTGLPSRSLLRDRLQRAVLQAVRDRSRLALLFIDLDRFKEVNDSLGHEAGDDLLRMAAQRLKQTLREADTVGRLGGDEFVVLLPQLHSVDEARMVGEKLLKSMQAPFMLRNTQVSVSASIGVSVYPDDGQDGDELMRHADSAMYRAKGSGRDAVCFFSPEAEKAALLGIASRSGLRRAVTCDELVLHFQPQIDMSSGRLCGLEALLRWQHPERGLLHPLAFLSALDDSGLATLVGDWVIQATGRQMAAWRNTVLADVPVSLNVSPLQLRGTSLVRSLSEMLGQTGIRPDQLEIEITEHALVDNRLGAAETLRDCRQLGVGIALDDFGTGFSSLSVLHQHPISRIKIDRSFCSRLPDDPKALAIVRAMIDMARNLSMGVLAEGIETQGQAQCVRDAGCNVVQGYLFARPASAQAIEAWWQADRAEVSPAH